MLQGKTFYEFPMMRFHQINYLKICIFITFYVRIPSCNNEGLKNVHVTIQEAATFRCKSDIGSVA